MSTKSLHLIDKEVDEEELLEMERMEIRSRVESPSLRSATVLETRMTSISSQLTTMSQQQGHFSKKLKCNVPTTKCNVPTTECHVTSARKCRVFGSTSFSLLSF